MDTWLLKNITYLSEGSNKSDNSGQLPLVPKYRKTFINLETQQLKSVTDLESKIYKRDKILEGFIKVYGEDFKLNNISIFSAVVNQEKYLTMGKFLNTFTRKLKRKGIDRLGYIWVRDVGDFKFHLHYHILIATERINEKQFNELFKTKKHNDYEIQFVKSPKGISGYLKDKELYGTNKQRSYAKSREFCLSKQINMQGICHNARLSES